ncbi:hypothetical protein C8A05DRAFT_39651 [Staphylotrichum tortipilum]|uniref:Uncharacterized protein n=1 Tax=Staphylotrichum tortipilum TaxID=2831512 RepID=A0AAN6MAE8_9PEZI|nr:hypothetical protein C8A05DRAFT_39651 [Staphylotrichum longicolle]
MARTAPNAVVFLIMWLLFATTTCLANKHPSASISFTPGVRSQRRQRRTDQYGAAEMVHGPLVPRMHHLHNQSELRGRAAPANEYGPLVVIPGCFYCVPDNIAKLKGRDLLKSLTTEAMISYIRAGTLAAGALKNKCVFYTASRNKAVLPNLSKIATDWACLYGKYSIWHLWPNKAMANAEPDEYKDFYGIDETNNWLHSIKGIPTIYEDKGVPPMTQYFQHMSEAMAKLCSGQVVVMTEEPDNMIDFKNKPLNPNIWWDKERKALLPLVQQGVVTSVIVVNSKTDEMFNFDLENSIKGAAVPASVLLSSRSLLENDTDSEAARLLHRDICLSNGLAQMPAAGDPFTDNYALFA